MKRALPVLLALAACGTPVKDTLEEDAGVVVTRPSDGGATDAGAKDGGVDAGLPDAGPLTAVTYPRVGSANDSVITPAGPGLILMGGGTDVDDAFVWAHATVAGTNSGRVGDVVIVRASGANGYDSYIYGLANWSSVQTIRLPPAPALSDMRAAAALVDKAELVFFAGGNQAQYVPWKGGPLETAIEALYARGCGTGRLFTMTVSGTATNAYSVDPYTVAAAAGSCP